MNPIISTPDTYESAYYLANEAEVTAVECRKIDGKIACTLQFSGEDLTTLQYQYFRKTAEVNLYAFKRAYHQINMIMADAKKKFKKEQAAEMEGGRE